MNTLRLLVIVSSIIMLMPHAGSATTIFEAAEQGDLAQVQALLDEDPQLLNAVDEGGYTALHEAAYGGHIEVLDYLIARGANLNATSNSGSTPLHGAAFHGHVQAAEHLIEKGAAIDMQNAGGFTPLLGACAGGRLDEAALLIDRGADVHARTAGEITALVHATNSRNVELVQLLIEKGADVNAVTANNETALYRALWHNSQPIVELLIEHGADANVTVPNQEISLLYFAVAYRDSAMANRLMGPGADFEQRNELQMTMLHYAAARGFADQVEKLVRGGADVNAVCINGKTPLYYATIWGHDQIVDYLAESGADPSVGRASQFTGDYLGFEPPGRTPQAFAENALLTPLAPHGSIAFSPDGREMFWCHHALPIQAMWHMTRAGDTWSLPQIAPFTDPAAEYSDGSPSFSADGSRLFFHSHRPVTNEGGKKEDSDIWYVEKQGDGWGKPISVGSPVNTDKGEYGPAIGASGDLYFIGSDYDNSIGAGDIYVSRFVNGKYTEPHNLGPAINSEFHELGPVLAPDESYMLFASNRPDLGRRTLALYVSFKNDDGEWTDAINLSRGTTVREGWHPCISPDGKYIFYLQGNNYYWFSAEVISEMKRAVIGPGEGAAPSVEAPHFRKSEQTFPLCSTKEVPLGDLDGDGDLDAIACDEGDGKTIWLNDGTGNFIATGQKLSDQVHGASIGDLDADGDLDLVLAVTAVRRDGILYEKPSKVFLNDGQGRFHDSNQDLEGFFNIHLLDVDTDGDLDALGIRGEPAILYINDGTGTFTASDRLLPNIAAMDDVDADGDVDLFVRETGVGLKVMLNDGGGNFSDGWQLADSTVTRGDVSLGDLDGDGDPDAVVTNGRSVAIQPTLVLFNDGAGRFPVIDQDLPYTGGAGVAIGDLNQDGYPDAFVTNYGIPDQVWINDGTGHLVDTGFRIGGYSMNMTGSLGDLDGDGDLDIFVAEFFAGPNVIWFNESE